jgi:hypothetical protein
MLEWTDALILGLGFTFGNVAAYFITALYAAHQYTKNQQRRVREQADVDAIFAKFAEEHLDGTPEATE